MCVVDLYVCGTILAVRALTRDRTNNNHRVSQSSGVGDFNVVFVGAGNIMFGPSLVRFPSYRVIPD